MIEKTPICPERVRKISGSFAFIEHRFLRDGFFQSLPQSELLLYLFLVLVADRSGLSYYTYEKICTLLRFSINDYLLARNQLIQKDLTAFDGICTRYSLCRISLSFRSQNRLKQKKKWLKGTRLPSTKLSMMQ